MPSLQEIIQKHVAPAPAPPGPVPLVPSLPPVPGLPPQPPRSIEDIIRANITPSPVQPRPAESREAELRRFAQMDTGEVLRQAIMNLPRSSLRNIGDMIAIIKPFEGGPVGDPKKGFRVAPNLQELVLLLSEISGAGVPRTADGAVDLDAIRRGVTLPTPRLDAVIDFYKQNYSIGPENEGGFKQYVAEDPAGFLSDAMSILSFGAGTVAKGAKLGQVASTAAQASRFNRAAALTSRLKVQRYLIPIEKGARIAQNIFDWADPTVLPVRSVALGLKHSPKITAPFRADVDPRMLELEEQFALDLPASAKSKSKLVPILEGAAIKAGNRELRLRVEKVNQDLTELADQMVARIGGSPDLTEAGSDIAAGLDAYKRRFEDNVTALYSRLEAAKELPASTDVTRAALTDILAVKRSQGAAATNRAFFQGLLEDLDRGSVTPADAPKNIRRAFGASPTDVFEFEYRVVDLDELIPSNLDSGAINPNFPAELQPRDRSRSSSQLQINKMAKRLVPDALLTDIGLIDRGAMIVGPDMVVESGNGRVLGLRRARESHPEKLTEYQDRLREVASSYGISPSQVSSKATPVLVRVRRSDVDRVAFAREANRPAVLEMSPSELALIDADTLPDEILQSLQLGADASIDRALRMEGNAVVGAALLNNLPENARAALVDKGGKLNRLGLERVKAAVLAKTFPGESGGRMAESFIESADEGMKNIENAIFGALPSLAESESLVRSGNRSLDLSLSEDLSVAVQQLAELRNEGTSVADFMAQGMLFGDQGATAQRALLAFLDENARSSKKIRELLNSYAEAVTSSPDLQQTTLLAEAPRTKGQILSDLLGTHVDEGPIPERLEAARAVDAEIRSPSGEPPAQGTILPTRRPEVSALGVSPAVAPVIDGNLFTFENLKQTRTAMGQRLGAKTDPITVGDKKQLDKLYAAYTQDLMNTVVTARPDLATAWTEATTAYREGIQKINSAYGRKIYRLRDQPDLIVPQLFSARTSAADIPRIFEIVGDDAKKSIQATFLNTLFEGARADDVWKPHKLTNDLKKFGAPKLVALLGEDGAKAVQDLAEVMAAQRRLTQITEGSQTGFINQAVNQMLVAGDVVGGAIAVTSQFYGGGMEGVLVGLSAIIGRRAFRRWIASDAGQRFLLEGRAIPERIPSALDAQRLTRPLFQAGRAADLSQNRSERQE